MVELDALPDRMLRNFVCRYEDGGVQRRPRLRFVDDRGRACLAGALTGARTSREFADSAAGRSFRQGPLLRLSREFEAGRLSAAQLYDACLMELARRSTEEDDRPERETTGAAGVGAGA